MSDLRIIPINAANRAQFDALSQTYIDDTGCITLTQPSSDAAVDAFIYANSATAFKASAPIGLPIGKGIIFSTDATKEAALPTLVNKPAKTSTDLTAKQHYNDYVAQARALIIATVSAIGTFVSMDPIHNTAIFVRTAPDKPWSIMRTEVIPKIKYIEDLLNHPKIKDLDNQLAIHTYEKNGVKTRVLTRFYKGHNTYSFFYNAFKVDGLGFVQAAPMYILNADGTVERRYTPEDFFIDKFQKIPAYHQSMSAAYGKLIEAETKLLTAADLDLCRPFVEHDTHFVVYKNRRDRFNKAISGNFLQRGTDGHYVIQDDDDTALDYTIRYFSEKTSTATNTISISVGGKITPTVETWQTYNYSFVKKIEAVPQGVKIEFSDKSYIVDSGNKLTLHGKTEDDHLTAMVLHAKKHWGGQFKIDNASPAVRDSLIRLARTHNVTVIGMPPTSPLRPGVPPTGIPAGTPAPTTT